MMVLQEGKYYCSHYNNQNIKVAPPEPPKTMASCMVQYNTLKSKLINITVIFVEMKYSSVAKDYILKGIAASLVCKTDR